MLQNVYGIKQFQNLLPSIAQKIKDVGGHYIITKRSTPVFVAIPFDDYKEIQDILLELNSPKLQKDIAEGRRGYKSGKTKDFEKFIKDLE